MKRWGNPGGTPEHSKTLSTTEVLSMGNANSGRRPDLKRRRQIVWMRELGLSMSEIGRRLGISRQTHART